MQCLVAMHWRTDSGRQVADTTQNVETNGVIGMYPDVHMTWLFARVDRTSKRISAGVAASARGRLKLRANIAFELNSNHKTPILTATTTQNGYNNSLSRYLDSLSLLGCSARYSCPVHGTIERNGAHKTGNTDTKVPNSKLNNLGLYTEYNNIDICQEHASPTCTSCW